MGDSDDTTTRDPQRKLAPPSSLSQRTLQMRVCPAGAEDEDEDEATGIFRGLPTVVTAIPDFAALDESARRAGAAVDNHEKHESAFDAERAAFESRLESFVTGGRGPSPAASHMPNLSDTIHQPLETRTQTPSPVATPVPREPQAAATKHEVSSPLFRVEALAAYQRGDKAASVLRVTSASRWMLLFALATAMTGALGMAAFGSVEVTSAARGVLRAPGGVQPVVTQIAGIVREVALQTGDHVAAGQVIARIDAAPLRAELQEMQQRLALFEGQRARDGDAARKAYEHSKALSLSRASLLEQRLSRQAARSERERTRVARLDTLSLKGLVEAPVRDARVEAFEQSRDESLRIRDELWVLKLQMANDERALLQEESAASQRVAEAQARADAVTVLLQQTEITAPTAGKLESLRVYPGQSVQSGELITRIVRDVRPNEIIAFLPERDRAFLKEGARANVEVDQLPVAEFGLVPARVTRIGSDLADGAEMQSALGDDGAPHGPHFRVELTLLDGPYTEHALPYLRPGTQVTARVALRERRILGLAFDPLRKWVE